MKQSIILLLQFLFAGHLLAQSPFLMILGTVQDGGSPHIACSRDCCKNLFKTPDPDRMVVALGLIDPAAEKRFMFEATPDLPRQLHILNEFGPYGDQKGADGIFLTHAHIGHYTGLMHFGKEAMNSSAIPVYTMPRMASFLRSNGPWDRLISLQNITIKQVQDRKPISLTSNLQVTPIQVPHRDEYSETVGFIIKGPEKTAVFIPDIDKWEKWDMDIKAVISESDYAFLDGSFFSAEEVGYRDISEIPHPFIPETIEVLRDMAPSERSKVHFIHFNHTNPVLNSESEARRFILHNGFQISNQGDRFTL